MTNKDVDSSVVRIKLGMEISSYRLDEQAGVLFIQGPAIVEGEWTDMNGKKRFYPREVLREGSHLYNDVPLVCEHRGIQIGQVVKVEPTELGFDVVEAYLTNPVSIVAVMTGEKTGLSIEGSVDTDPFTGIITKMISADNISLVGTPACKVCRIKNTHLEGKDMVEEKIQDGALVVEKVEPAPKGFASALMKFDNLIDKFANLLAGTKPEPVAMSALTDLVEDVVEHVEQKVEDVAKQVEQAIVEVIEPVVEPAVVEPILDAIIDPVVEQVEAVVEQVADQVIAQVDPKVAELEATLAKMTAQMDELINEKMALSAQDKTNVEKIVSEIVTIDSNSDVEMLKTMTVIQLSAYKAKVESLTKPTVGKTKMSAPRDASPVKDGMQYITREEFILGLAEVLKSKQK